jgi:hypothetical protein
MVVSEGIPKGVWASAMKSYLQVVGTSREETPMWVFLGFSGWRNISSDGATIQTIL